MRCEAFATTRSEVSARFDSSYPCPHPAKFHVVGRTPERGRPTRGFVCGVHAREFSSPFSPWRAVPLPQAPEPHPSKEGQTNE